MKPYFSATTIKGLSLVELMIALVLGSMITFAAIQLFLVNRHTENLQFGLSSLQHDGQFTFTFLNRQLMNAGFSDDGPIEPFLLSGVGAISDGDVSDQLAIIVPQGQQRTCAGGLTTVPHLVVIRMNNNSNRDSLQCVDFQDADLDGNYQQISGSAQPLIENVVAFQVLYGLDFDTPESANGYGQVDVYTHATGVTQALNNNDNARIVSVRYGLLLSSPQKVTTQVEYVPESITLLDRIYDPVDAGNGNVEIDLASGQLYRSYTSTIALRNLTEPGL